MALLAPQIRPPRIIGMEPLDLTPAELGQPPVAAPAAQAPADAPSMRGQPRPGTPSPYDGDLLQGADAEPRAPGRRFNAGDILAGIGAAASELNGNPGAINAWRASREARGEAERQRAAQAERAARIQGIADELGLEGRERLAFEIDPEKWISEFGQPAAPQTIEGPDGIYERTAEGWQRVADYPPPLPELLIYDVDGNGADDITTKAEAYRRLGIGGQPRPGTPTPVPAQGEAVPPNLLQGAVPLNPTEAPATVGAAPQGFSNRNDMLGFVRQAIPGARPSSGYRTQAEQDALVARGVTRAKRSSHTYSGGQDIVPPGDPSTWGPYADQLRASGRFRKVIIETGRGRNQGTAPHIHLEPY